MTKPAASRPTTDRIDTGSILDLVENLPTLPVVALRVGELVHEPSTSARDIARAMQGDPSLSAKVLRLVNSPYYGIPGGVSDVQRAISFIGFSTLHRLVLSVSVLQALSTPAGGNFDAKGLWLHSLAVGACADVLAKEIGFTDAGACFTAGLLHDIGKIALADAAPDRFGHALDVARQSGTCMARTERDAGLPPHDRVGSRLARRWKFPATLLAPIEYHHSAGDQEVRRRLSSQLLTLVDIVALADHLCRRFDLGDSGSPADDAPDGDALDRLGFSPTRVDALYTELMKRLEVSRSFLELVQ